MIIVNYIIIFVAVFIIAKIINGVEDYHTTTSLLQLSFIDTMGTLNLPVVSLTNNGKSFNFLVDTGASLSIIDESVLNKFDYKKIAVEGNAYGIDGNIIPVEYAKIKFNSDETQFVEEFQVMRVNAFDNIKETHGIEIAGILGSAFLKRYNFIVDFNQLIVYIPKETKKE